MKLGLERLAFRYGEAINRAPIRTKMLTNLGIGCFGDYICQATMQYRLKDDQKALVDQGLDGWDPIRTLRQGVVGMVFHTIPLHLWLTCAVPSLVISPRLVPSLRWNKFATCILRIGAHCTFVMPYMQSAMYFGIGSFQYFSLEEGKNCWDANFMAGYSLALIYWPFIMLGLYGGVPARFGNLYMDSWNVLWGAIVSYVANRPPGTECMSWGKAFR